MATTINLKSGLLTGLPIIPAADVSWQNRTFEPEGKEMWASVFFVSNPLDGDTIGEGGRDSLTGFLQIDFNTATFIGEELALEWTEKALNYFPHGRVFSSAGQKVEIIESGISQGRIVDNYYRKSLTAGFRAFASRPVVTV